MNNKKKGNVTLTVKCEYFEMTEVIFLKSVEKLGIMQRSATEKARTNLSVSELLHTQFEMWESGGLIVPGKNLREDLYRYLHTHYFLPCKNDANREIALSTIKSIMKKF